MGGEHLEIQPGVDQHHDRRTAVEPAVVIDVGIAEVIVVASRTAEMRNAAERGAKRRQHDFLTAGQPVEQRQRKAVVLDRRQRVAAAVATQAFDQLLCLDQAEAIHLVDQLAGDGKASMVEADCRHAAAPIAL